MHMEMLLILLVVLVVAQVLLVQWKKWHFKSYQVDFPAFFVVIFILSKKLLYFSDRYLNGHVDNPRYNLFTTKLVAIFDNLVHIFYVNVFNYFKSHSKTHFRQNSEVFLANFFRISFFRGEIGENYFFRLVYKWFLLLHKLSYVLGIVGYFVILFTLMGFNMIFGAKASAWMDAGIMLLFYGLYYGVLGRDFAEICADSMASHIGVIPFGIFVVLS